MYKDDVHVERFALVHRQEYILQPTYAKRARAGGYDMQLVISAGKALLIPAFLLQWLSCPTPVQI